MQSQEQRAMDFTKWTRCGEYNIESVSVNGLAKMYIRPVPWSGYIRYDVADNHRKQGSRKVDENNLVQSLLNLNTSDEQEIIKFVNQFGLLGLLPCKYLEPMSPPEGYENLSKPWLIPKRDGTGIVLPEEIEETYLFSFTNLPMSWKRGYGRVIHMTSEPLDEFVEAVKKFQEVGTWITIINKCAKSEATQPLRSLFLKIDSADYKDLAKNGEKSELIKAAAGVVAIWIQMNSSEIKRVIVPGDQDQPWIVKWEFDSLLGAAYFFLSEYMLSNFWIGQCDRCGRHFISSIKTQGYCSRKCEDAVRKARSRKAKEEQNDNTSQTQV